MWFMASLKSNVKEYKKEPYRRKVFICTFGGNIASIKSNLNEHTPLINTEEKLFSASCVAKLPLRSTILRSIHQLFIQESYHYLHILWQLGQYELKHEEAHCAEAYWREALLCKFCGKWQAQIPT